jgi:hypothetical protein
MKERRRTGQSRFNLGSKWIVVRRSHFHREFFSQRATERSAKVVEPPHD